MIPFALLGIVGDQFYLKGVKEQNLFYFQVAKEVFPFEKEMLVGEALILIRNKIVNEQVALSLKKALIYDPYSAEMLAMYAQYANLYGNKNEALMAFKKLEKISPNSNVLKEMKKLGFN